MVEGEAETLSVCKCVLVSIVWPVPSHSSNVI